MLTSVLQSLLAPRYPRRYIGRHRARVAFGFQLLVPTHRRAAESIMD